MTSRIFSRKSALLLLTAIFSAMAMVTAMFVAAPAQAADATYPSEYDMGYVETDPRFSGEGKEFLPLSIVAVDVAPGEAVTDLDSTPRAAGVTFAIYKDAAMTDLLTTLTTGEDGFVSINNVAPGTYYYTFVSAQNGYYPEGTATGTISKQLIPGDTNETRITNSLKHYYQKGSLSYDGNGAESGAIETTQDWVKTTTAVSKNAFARTGYTFTGWNTSADGSGTDVKEGSTFTYVTGETTLYAQWAKDAVPSTTQGHKTSVPPADSTTPTPSTKKTVTTSAKTKALANTGADVAMYVIAMIISAALGVAARIAMRKREAR